MRRARKALLSGVALPLGLALALGSALTACGGAGTPKAHRLAYTDGPPDSTAPATTGARPGPEASAPAPQAAPTAAPPAGSPANPSAGGASSDPWTVQANLQRQVLRPGVIQLAVRPTMVAERTYQVSATVALDRLHLPKTGPGMTDKPLEAASPWMAVVLRGQGFRITPDDDKLQARQELMPGASGRTEWTWEVTPVAPFFHRQTLRLEFDVWVFLSPDDTIGKEAFPAPDRTVLVKVNSGYSLWHGVVSAWQFIFAGGGLVVLSALGRRLHKKRRKAKGAARTTAKHPSARRRRAAPAPEPAEIPAEETEPEKPAAPTRPHRRRPVPVGEG